MWQRDEQSYFSNTSNISRNRMGQIVIIGLSGYASAGKDSVAQILVEKFGYKRMAFADAIRDILYTLDPLTNNGLHLRTVVDDYGWDLAKQDNEIRRLLQVLGTEVGRNVFGDDVWVDVLISKLEPMDKVVITDVRFPNEARELHNLAGEIWRVNREGVSAINEHVSESQMDEYNFDKIIDNNGSLEDLEHAIVELIEANNE